MNESEEIDGVDVLILVALKEELDELLLVDTYAAEGTVWTEYPIKQDCSQLPYWIRDFRDKGDGRFRIAAARSTEMGSDAIIYRGTELISNLKPRRLAMCGICAASRADAQLGDVIVADKIFRYDMGKEIEHRNPDGSVESVFFPEIYLYELNRDWKYAAQDLEGTPSWHKDIGRLRPISFRFQEHWVREALAAYEDGKKPSPLKRPDDRRVRCPDWSLVLERLRKDEQVEMTEEGLALTPKGKILLKEDRVSFPDGLPQDKEMTIRVGPIATGSNVVQSLDEGGRARVFNAIRSIERKILGIDMEASAVGNVAKWRGLPCIVAKGVQDYADEDKDDRFRRFAARASARFLIEFFHRQLAQERGHAQGSSSEASQPPGKVNSQGTLQPIADLPPLNAAVLNGNTAAVEALLSAGNASENEDNLASSLLLAISRRYEGIASTLVANGANVNARRDVDGKTALILAVDRRMYQLSQALLRKGADVNALDAYGSSPIALAVGHNDSDTALVRLLLAYGARMDSHSTANKTTPTAGKPGSFFTRNHPPQRGPVTFGRMNIVQIGEPRQLEPTTSATGAVGECFHCTFAAPPGATVLEAWIEVTAVYVDGVPATIIKAGLLDEGGYGPADIDADLCARRRDQVVLYNLGTNRILCQLIGSPDRNLEGSHPFAFWVLHGRSKELRCIVEIEATTSTGTIGQKAKEFKTKEFKI